ncbi:MAG: radical superfamily enzyme, MoaA/NifB/PqqE/SkfB family [Firmicutes bacterium]|nr:radical superfamily enzyme, MoaA/NifB/PqqE/SkfB family [Bacillota bacterium]
MEYNGTVYRPPMEAETFLIPVTEGCTHNSCRFCNMYKDVDFRMLSLTSIEEFLRETKKHYGRFMDQLERVYLVGADPFALSADKLENIIHLIRKYCPKVHIITMYAAVRNITIKTDAELKRLAELGVNDIYVGIETGSTASLTYLNKGNTAKEAKEQCLRLNAAGIRHRDMMMPGAAGKGKLLQEAEESAKLENATKPDMVILTTMSIFPGTELEQEVKNGTFTVAPESEVLMAEKRFIELLDLPDTYLWAAHSLDSTRIAGLLREEKEAMLNRLQHSIDTMDDEKFRQTFRRDHL